MKELEAGAGRNTQLLAVVEKDTRGEARWLRSKLEGSRWTVALAEDSFREAYDYGLAPVSYMLDRKGKIKSIIK